MKPEEPKLLDLLNNHSDEHNIGSVGSPSSTTEITLDINQKSESKKVLGQLVYFVQPQEQSQLVVLGQISEVETQNRWHEDLTFRGIIKRRGSLPHLSGKADVRTATLGVQACFSVVHDEEVNEGTLGISPSTGVPIFGVRDEILDKLLAKYVEQTLYLGNAYATDVKMPVWLKHFDRADGGAGEAYHIGVFGKSGSGKSGLAAYMLLGYARHKNMSIIFIDPQNQFASDTDLPFKLHTAIQQLGRYVQKYSLTNQIRLGTTSNAVKLFVALLQKTDFFRSIGVRSSENKVYAGEEVARIINQILHEEKENSKGKPDEKDKGQLASPPANLCNLVLTRLNADTSALGRIYGSQQPLQRLKNDLNAILSNDVEMRRVNSETWQPVLDLFMRKDSKNNQRESLWKIVSDACEKDKRSVVFLDIKGEGTSFADDDEVKALILREISSILRAKGEEAFKSNQRLNCLICLDEAHRFVRGSVGADDTSEMSTLTKTFVDAVRTTRKYGLGYMFITQTVASLHKEIVQQLRLYAFGYGLTSGSEYRQIEELVSDKQALSLYKSFVDPQSSRQYPFMFIGPISPLSFTGSPLFIQMFTEFGKFQTANKMMTSKQ